MLPISDDSSNIDMEREVKQETARCLSTNNMKDLHCDDNIITEANCWKEILSRLVPHLLLNVCLIAYIFGGGYLFQTVDEEIRKKPLNEVLLFVFTTITTIGYGDIVPTSHNGKLFCMAYCIFGVPIIFLLFSHSARLLTELLGLFVRKNMASVEQDLPIWLTGSLLLLHSVLGGFLFSFGIDEMRFIPAVYFCFISIATIGYGDIIPNPDNSLHIIIIILYLSTGITLLSTFLGSLSSYLKWIHTIGRNVSESSRDTEIWFGGDRITVKQLVTIVAEQFDVSPIRLSIVLQDLDDVLTPICVLPEETTSLITRQYTIGYENKPKQLWTERDSRTYLGPCFDDYKSSPTQMKKSSIASLNTENAVRALAVLHHKLKKQGSLKQKPMKSLTV